RWVAYDAQQVEELDVGPLGQPVEPVQHDLGEVGERLDEDHARVMYRKVGPLRTGGRDLFPGLADQIREAPVVEVGDRDAHDAPPRAMDSSRRSVARLVRPR